MTQPPGTWNETVQGLGWKFEPTERIREIFAGTARNKMRPWWLTYTTSNYIATSRAPFNPMEYVFRTTGMVRGSHPYGLVIDDLRKDGSDHLYQWCGMLSGGVWEAKVPDVPKGALVLAYDHTKDAFNIGMTAMAPYDAKPHQSSLSPSKGDPLLLVVPVTPDSSGDSSLPPIKVETSAGPLDKKGVPQNYDRLVISTRAKEGHFKVLLIPFRMGDRLPSIAFDPKSSAATVTWGDQKDILKFHHAENGLTGVTVTRDGKPVVASLK